LAVAIETFPFDSAVYLDTPEAQTIYLSLALEEGDEDEIKHAIATVARARGMAETAKGAAVSRQALYKSLSGKTDPKFSTILGVLRALGMQLSVHSVGQKPPR
jgi:probable addiction module antidote protein